MRTQFSQAEQAKSHYPRIISPSEGPHSLYALMLGSAVQSYCTVVQLHRALPVFFVFANLTLARLGTPYIVSALDALSILLK